MESAGADFHIQGLQYDATLFAPELLERQDQRLETAGGVTLGGWNAVRDNFRGLQVGLLNTVGLETAGAQYGFLNWAGILDGHQVGVFNHAWTLRGFQVGIMNTTGHLEGVQIGLLNVVTERYPFSAVPLFSMAW